MVDRIKPQSGELPIDEVAASSHADRSKVLDFAKVRSKSDDASSVSVSHPASGVVGTFRKSELNDQGKLKTIVRATLSELVESECKELGQIPPYQREVVLDYLEQNPFVQQKIQNYLSTVLS
jgi:hypothetical protein